MASASNMSENENENCLFMVQVKKLLENGNGTSMDDDDGLVVYLNQENTIICCEKCNASSYKTKGGYDRHMRTVHDDTDNKAKKMDDCDVLAVLQSALCELGSDTCYPVEIREKRLEYKITPNPYLYHCVEHIYAVLIETSNAEKCYEQFYSQLLFSPCYFTGLDYNLGVELLRKFADKLLARYQLDVKSGCMKGSMPTIITASEMDALEYLGGDVLRKIQDTFARKKLKAPLTIDCFKSEDVKNQPLIHLLDRGGLTGITPRA